LGEFVFKFRQVLLLVIDNQDIELIRH